MSTASKVLIILVILAVLGWTFLVAKVAQVNANYGQAVVQKEETLKQREEALAKAKADLLASRLATISAEQQSVRSTGDWQGKLESTTGLLAQARESQSRLAIQLESMQTAQQESEQGRDYRKDELADWQKRLEEQKTASAESQKANEEKLATLQALRGEYKRLLEENQRLLSSVSGVSARNVPVNGLGSATGRPRSPR